MTDTIQSHRYLYSFKYDYHHSELCKLESRQVFGAEEQNKLLFSDLNVDPSLSPFMKNRLEIIASSGDYSTFLKNIRDENILMDGFKVEYLMLNGDATEKAERREKAKDIGYCIDSAPDYKNPSVTYAVCQYENSWYFGILTKQSSDWRKHKKKPFSFSNSISMNIAKTLVSIASKGDAAFKLLDACCGVGTIMLESCFDGISIEGCDINPKRCRQTRENLLHYQYRAEVHCSDIQDLDQLYDAVIVDLPYNLYSYSNDDIASQIIGSAAKLSNRVVIVSTADVRVLIEKSGLSVADFCIVEKRGKPDFTRKIWVCEPDSEYA